MSTTKAADKKPEERKQVDFSTLDCVNLTFRRPAKWYMYVVKQVLKFKEQIDIRARPSAAAQVVHDTEAPIRTAVEALRILIRKERR